MKKFHVIIKNLETDEILVDETTSAILGAMDHGESTTSIVYTSCGVLEMTATAAGAYKAANEAAGQLPKRLAKLAKKLGNKKD